MGFFGWLLGVRRAKSGRSRMPHAPTGKRCNVQIVGESQFQAELEKIAGPKSVDGVELVCQASVVRDKGNLHDPNAIKVEIEGLTVGYLPAKLAAIYAPFMDDRGADRMALNALIVGGWKDGRSEGHFGIRINLARKP